LQLLELPSSEEKDMQSIVFFSALASFLLVFFVVMPWGYCDPKTRADLAMAQGNPTEVNNETQLRCVLFMF
jgi:hypothetical protein